MNCEETGVVSVTIKIAGKEIVVPVDEAMVLYSDMNKLFKKKESVLSPYYGCNQDADYSYK